MKMTYHLDEAMQVLADQMFATFLANDELRSPAKCLVCGASQTDGPMGILPAVRVKGGHAVAMVLFFVCPGGVHHIEDISAAFNRQYP